MSTYKKILLGITTAISLSVSSAVLADGVETVLNPGSATNKEHSLRNNILKRIKNPVTIQDHVINFQIDYKEKHANNDKEIAATDELAVSGWRKNLGNPVKI